MTRHPRRNRLSGAESDVLRLGTGTRVLRGKRREGAGRKGGIMKKRLALVVFAGLASLFLVLLLPSGALAAPSEAWVVTN